MANTNNRPLIIHTINSLSRGGAEILLSNTIALFREFRHLVVYLHQPCDLGESIEAQGAELICLGYKDWTSLPFAVWKLNKIIRTKKPVMVHSHLFYSTLYARLATPASVPLLSTIHSIYSADAFKKNRKSLLAARLTLKKRHSIIGVSDYVLKDYLSYVPFEGKRFVLYNFLPDVLFKNTPHKPPAETKRLVAVGNLKEAKNYFYLLQVIKHLKGVSLDIYGTGPLEEQLSHYISKEKLNVNLCGSIENVHGIFEQYDFFIQASLHEGFGLSVIEAMSSGIPVLLSDIPVFREITGGFANFFPLDRPREATGILAALFTQPYPVALAEDAFKFVKQQYSAVRYKEHLLSIYEQVAEKKLLLEPSW